MGNTALGKYKNTWRQNEKLKEYLPRANLANMEEAGE